LIAPSLAECTLTTARKLGFVGSVKAQALPILLSGSLFTYSALLKAIFTEAIQVEYPNATPFETDRAPAVGAAALALHTLNITPLRFEIANNSELIPASRRSTERRNPLTMKIARYDAALLHMMNLEDERVPRLLRTQIPALAELAAITARKLVSGGRLFLVGAGTSGRLAVLDAAECRPTFSTDQVIGIIAGGDPALLVAVEGAEDDPDLGARQLLMFNPGGADVVIGIAASGSTPWVIGAIQAARRYGAVTGCIVNSASSQIAVLADHPVVILTGAEALTGSTRLKAGSAQKMALNMLTTAALNWAGHTYGNLMTDVQRTNQKLNRRAVTIVQDATGASAEQAETILTASDGAIKAAILAIRENIPPDQATHRLDEVNGDLELV